MSIAVLSNSSLQVPFLELRPAYDELRAKIDAAIARSLESGWYIGGVDVELFESEFARYVGAQHCVGVGNGLDALTLALIAHGVGRDDEVIVPSHTFIATWLAVSRLGAKIVPIEPLETTMNIDPQRLELAITPRTRAIVPVHLYGLPAAMVEIYNIAGQRRIPVIEDAAQAHGAKLNGRRIGSMGNTCCWSFYPGKNLGAFGDGGAVTSDDESIMKRVRMLGNYGSEHKYKHELAGINSRLDPIQAAILCVKLGCLDEWNERRGRIAQRYRDELKSCNFRMQEIPEGYQSSNHLFVVRVRKRDQVMSKLAQRGIKTQIHYPIACREQQAYRDADLPRSPVASGLSSELLSLPMGPHFREDQVSAVIDAVKQACS